MTDDTADLDRILGRLSEEGRHRRDPEAHPSPERLSAYLSNELTPEEDDAIQEHLTACSLCSELLLDLQRFLKPPPEERPQEGVVDFEATAEWRALREKLRAPWPRRLRRFFDSPKTAYGIAAMLLLMVGALYVQLSRTGSGLNAYVVSLSSTVGVLAPGDEIMEVDVPPEAESVLFMLGTSKGGYPSYRGEMSAIEERGWAWQFSDLRKMGDHFTFEIPRRLLASGDYKIQVFGLKNGSEDLVAERKVRLRLLAPADLPQRF